MAKFYGKIGFSVTEEKAKGVYEKVVTPKSYKGDILKDYINNKSTEYLNDDIVVNNTISIVADRFAMDNFSTIVYAEWLGVKWKVTSIDASKPPRLNLNLGGVYNG
jgi:hypothetical protein